MDFIDDSEESRTLFCGNLPSKCTEELLYELFLQAGPLEKVRIPLDREGRPVSYGFITFRHQCSVPYAMNIFDGITIFKTRVNLRLRNTNNAIQTPIMCNVPVPVQSPSPMALYQSNSNANANQNVTPNYNSREHNNRTPSGRNDYYRNESLQGRWNSHPYKRDRDMRPTDNRRHNSNYKRHKR